MRTPEQLGSLRKVLANTIGPVYARMLTDEAVDKWADTMQEHIYGICLEWTIRVRIGDDIRQWVDIEKEPKVIRASTNAILKSCSNLFGKFPSIKEIYLESVEYPDTHVLLKKP